MAELYPEVDNLQNYYKSDTITIKEIVDLGDNKYSVSVTNEYTNGFGKRSESQIVLYTQPKDPKKPRSGYEIYDSKGLSDLSDYAVYKFAKHKGYLNEDGLTDQEVAETVVGAQEELVSTAKKFNGYLHDHVLLTEWSWENNSFTHSASGRGVIKNNTPYAIPDMTYVITYMKRDGTEVTQDSGKISYDEIRPHGMESFTFYTSYVGTASRAKIELQFDPDFLLQTVANGEFE